MPRLLDELATRYADRIVIFDSPPLLATSEARVLASHVGQVVLVARADMTSHGALRESLALLEQCPMVCTLLNGASTPPLGSYYGYSDGADTKPA
jgi:receptor protein-tyrosine kinase